MSNSETPRTDAEDINILEQKGFVEADFARELERELAASKAEVDRAMYHIVEWRRYAGRAEKAEAEVARLRNELQGLKSAAQAVVDRWETPLWKDAEPTAYVIYRLRNALAPTPEEAVSLHPAIRVIKEKMSPEKAEEVRKIRLLIGVDELEKIANTPEPAPEWRVRAEGEPIQYDDKVKICDEWHYWDGETGRGTFVGEFWKEGEVRTRRPLPKQEEERLLKVMEYCRKWADEHLAGHGKETFYARLGLLVDFATDLYRDEIEALKKNQK
jgi:hypothetical protein